MDLDHYYRVLNSMSPEWKHVACRYYIGKEIYNTHIDIHHFEPISDFEIWLVHRGFNITKMHTAKNVHAPRIYDGSVEVVIHRRDEIMVFCLDGMAPYYELPNRDFEMAITGQLIPYDI